MSQVGGNLEQLTSLKGKFNTEAQDVQRLIASVSSALEATWWVGPAAERFKDAWRTEYVSALKKLDQALQEAGREVGNREQALRDAGT